MAFLFKEKKLQDLLSLRDNRSHYSINRDWFLGFVEAEGSFIGKENSPPIFEITQHSSDLFLFYVIKEWIGVGTVKINKRADGRELVVYTIRGHDNLRDNLLPLFQESLPETRKIERSFVPWCKLHFPDIQIGRAHV